jgi:hypothetical protein
MDIISPPESKLRMTDGAKPTPNAQTAKTDFK